MTQSLHTQFRADLWIILLVRQLFANFFHDIILEHFIFQLQNLYLEMIGQVMK